MIIKFLFIITSTLFLWNVRLADNSVPCACIEKANGDYVILNDTNKIEFHLPMLSRYNINVTNGVLIRHSNNLYKLVTKSKKEVKITVSEKETMMVLYTKKFRVLNSISELKPNTTTNSLTGCFSICRQDENYVHAGMLNRFVYFSNEKDIKIECENGVVSSLTKHGFNIKPNEDAKKVKIKFFYRKAEFSSWEYVVRK